MKTTKKFILAISVLMVLTCMQFTVLAPLPAHADNSLWSGQIGLGAGNSDIKNTFGENEDPRLIVAHIIKDLLGFLGIVFLGLLIWGGWKYMMSRGNDEEVTEALGLIKNAVIGLFIILAAWAIADYITDCVLDITTGNTIWMCK